MGIEPTEAVKGSVEETSFNGAKVKNEFVEKADSIIALLRSGKVDEVEKIISSESYTLKAYLEQNPEFASNCKSVLEKAFKAERSCVKPKIGEFFYSILGRGDLDVMVRQAARDSLGGTSNFGNYDDVLKIFGCISHLLNQNKANAILQEVFCEELESALNYFNFSKAEDLLSFLKNKNLAQTYYGHECSHSDVQEMLTRAAEKVIINKIKFGDVQDAPLIISYLARSGVIDLKPIITSETMVEACLVGIMIAACYKETKQHDTICRITDYMEKFGMADQVDRALRDAYRKGIDGNLMYSNPGMANNVYQYFQLYHKDMVDEQDMYKIMAKENSLR